METKDYIIIGLVVIIAAGLICAGLYMLNPGQKYKTINIIGTSMEVPESNATVVVTSDNYQEYVDESCNLTISAFDSVGSGLNDMSEAINFATQRELVQVGASEVTVNNITLNKSSNGTYSYLVNESHKNIIIYSSDSEVVAHVAQTIQIQDTNNTNNTTDNNTTNNIKQDTSKVSNSNSNSNVCTEHDTNGDGYCTKCGKYTRGQVTENGYQTKEELNSQKAKAEYADKYLSTPEEKAAYTGDERYLG